MGGRHAPGLKSVTAHLTPDLYGWLQAYRAARGLPSTAAAVRDALTQLRIAGEASAGDGGASSP